MSDVVEDIVCAVDSVLAGHDATILAKDFIAGVAAAGFDTVGTRAITRIAVTAGFLRFQSEAAENQRTLMIRRHRRERFIGLLSEEPGFAAVSSAPSTWSEPQAFYSLTAAIGFDGRQID